MKNARDIEAQAAEWLIRLDADSSREARAEFDAWIARDSRNHATFLRLEKGWRRADKLKNLRPIDGRVNDKVLETFPHAVTGNPDQQAPRAEPKNSAGLPLVLSVAALALITGVWITFVRAQTQVYRTDLGGFERVALQDGSTALLNTNTEIRVRFTKDRRQLELRRGEALFTVAHDPQRPFDVTVADTVVRAVGTVFSVKLGDHKQVDVIVTEGRVAIDPQDDSGNDKLAENGPLPISTLSEGESMRVNADLTHRPEVRKIDREDVSHKLAWVQGRLWFDRATLTEAVADFNRYNRRQMSIEDPAIADMKIGGAFDATDVDSFVTALGTFGIRALPVSQTGDANAQVIRLVKGRQH